MRGGECFVGDIPVEEGGRVGSADCVVSDDEAGGGEFDCG